VLIEQQGWPAEDLPSERSLRRILNRMNDQLKKIQKGRPLKKSQDTDAVFDNVQAVKAAARADTETREVSADTRAKVPRGDYSRGGKNTDRIGRPAAQGVGP